jgi:hypothetical protein
VSAGPIVRIDDITVASGQRGHFLSLLVSDYVPAAEARGLALVEIALSPPVDVPDRETDVVIIWHVPDVDAFWEARRAAMMDPRVASFWELSASLVARRTRRYASSSMTLPPVDDEPGVVPSSGGRHHIVLLALEAGTTPAVEGPVAGVRSWLGKHLPGSVGGIDASWEFDTDRAIAADELVVAHAQVEDVVVLGAPLGAGVRSGALRDGIKRTLLLRVEADAPQPVVAAFERDLLAMPRHIPAIRNWRLSRVDGSHTGWTHAWEQEYEDLSGLRDDYMRSPFHWGVVDGWFDAEDPRCIVAPELLHLFYEVPSSLLASPSRAKRPDSLGGRI